MQSGIGLATTAPKSGIYPKYIKRVMDIVLSLMAIIVFSPLLFTIAVAVRTKLGRQVIFKQERPGCDEKIFTLYKFRTMTDKKDEQGNLLPDGERLTSLGRWLRSTSFDELPELINIFKGDLSIVGPRPLAVQYLPFYTMEEHKRHTVRPGLSGLAQVNGRNALGWEEKFAYDLKYIENITFQNDAILVFKTFIKVIKRSNIGERGVDSPIDFDIYRRKQMNSENYKNEYSR